MANRIPTMRAAFLMFCVIAFFIVHATTAYAIDIPEVPLLKDAIKKYYATVDKAKLPYENELRRVLSNTQKAGNLKAYNAIEAELNHTIGKNGHCYTAFTPPQRTAMFSTKIALKRAVDNARQEFKETADRLASEYLKSGFVDLAREIDMLAKVVEPPRLNAVAGIQTFTVVWREAPHMKHVMTLARRGNLYAAWSSDDSKIATSGEDHFIVLWNATTGRELGELRRTATGRGTGVAFGADNKTVFFSGSGGEVGRWDSENRKLVWEEKTGKRWKGNATLSPSGKILCTGWRDGTYIWAADTGQLIHTLKEDQDDVGRAAFYAEGERLVTLTDKAANIWDTKTWKSICRLQNYNERAYGLAVAPDNKTIATGTNSGMVIFWNVQTGMPIQKLTGFGTCILALAFSPDGSKLAVGRHGDGEGVIILDTKTWKAIAFAPGHGPWNCQMAWDSKGRRIVIGGNDARVWTMPGK